MTFDEEHIDEIEEMFKLFLRGSGFYIPEEDMYTKEESDNVSEKCVHASDIKPWVGLSNIEAEIYGNQFNNSRLVREIEALLKKRNT